MIGRKFGKLTVVEKGTSADGARWICECECGNRKVIKTGHLNAGQYTSCGCNHFHGHATHSNRSKEYISYHNMINRCHKPSNKRYKDYGARGITVCGRWRSDFKMFLTDMGPCPEGMQIDRVDNTGPYSPENCRWADRKQNMQNKPGTYEWVVYGQRFSSARDAAKIHGVSQNTITAWCAGRVAEGRYYPPKPDCYRESRYA